MADYNMLNLNGGAFLYDLYLQNRGGREYLRSMNLLRQQFYKQPRTRDRIFWLSPQYPNQVYIEETIAFPFYSIYNFVSRILLRFTK